MKKVAVLGSGVVGQVLADGFLKYGWEARRASREPEKLAEWKAGAGPNASTGSFEDAAAWADVVVLAVKGSAAESAVDLAGVDRLAGKVVIDATNPIADVPPVNGVLSYFTGPNESLMERLQKKAPKARFVKAFSCVGNAHMVDPDFGGTKPSMFICGDDAAAKAEVKEVLTAFGWETEDVGGVASARGIEPLCLLWCIPAMTGKGAGHAFKLLHK
jgi:predicted dinucleotide-binding enzyme